MSRLVRFFSLITLALSSIAVLADDIPRVTHDGLHLVEGTKVAGAYMKPGADLGEYDKVAILEAYVAFRKDWQRDHNRGVMSPSQRVSNDDMEKIRTALADEFAAIFKEVLVSEGGHTMVTKGGSGVLIIRPAIINLDISAPDTMPAGRSRTFTTTAGAMTLYMELFDGLTGDIIARIIDPKAIDDGMIHYSSRVTNKADADRILRRWATLLNGHLADVKASSKAR